MSKVVCKTCACQTLRLFSSRCNADRKRQHCCCCHLLNKVDNIERALDISCTYNALEDTSKIAPSTTWFLGPTRVLTQMAPRSVSKRCVFAEQTISVCNQPVIVTQACSASHLSGNVFNCYVEVAFQCLFLPNCTN